jgi:hypothetical protein
MNGHLLVALLAVVCITSISTAYGDVEFEDIGYSPARALLQSGTNCPNQIPGCMARRCTTRTVDIGKDLYVCLRCKSGFLPILSANRKSIIQCSKRQATTYTRSSNIYHLPFYDPNVYKLDRCHGPLSVLRMQQ